MITNESITVYRCEFCKKKMFIRKAMEKHERYCYSNPENKKKCFDGCKHLKETTVDYSVEGGFYGNSKGFRCAKLDKLLFPLVVERKGLNIKFPETFDNQEPMPKECEHFETIP